MGKSDWGGSHQADGLEAEGLVELDCGIEEVCIWCHEREVAQPIDGRLRHIKWVRRCHPAHVAVCAETNWEGQLGGRREGKVEYMLS